jgi:Na+/melibiose symporter-like transporter
MGLPRAYLVAHFGKSLMWHGGNVAFAFYLTEICGQSPTLMAWTLAFSSVINAVADGLIGAILTRRTTEAADATRQQLLGSIAAGSAFAAFCAAGIVPEPWRLAFALTTLFAFRIAYAFVDVPQNALLAYLPADTAQQERLVSARMMTGYAAQMSAAILLSSLILRRSALDPVYFAVGGAMIGIMAIATASVLNRSRNAAADTHLAAARPIASDPPTSTFTRLLVASASFAFVSTLVIRLQAYIAAYGDGPTNAGASPVVPSMVAFVPIAMALGGLIGQPLWAILCRRGGAAATLQVASVALIGSALVFGASAAWGGVLVPLSTGLFGVALGGTSFALWTLLARSARDNPAARFGIFTCTSKLAHAASALTLGAVLAGDNYRASFAGAADLWSTSMIAAIAMGAALLVLIRAPLFWKSAFQNR